MINDLDAEKARQIVSKVDFATSRQRVITASSLVSTLIVKENVRIWLLKDITYTEQNLNWSYSSFESKIRLCKKHESTKALLRLCMSFHLKMIGTSCTDDARVKVPSFQKVTFFQQYVIFHRDAIHLYFCLFEDVSDCRDYSQTRWKWFAAIRLLFLLRNSMKTNTTS